MARNTVYWKLEGANSSFRDNSIKIDFLLNHIQIQISTIVAVKIVTTNLKVKN